MPCTGVKGKGNRRTGAQFPRGAGLCPSPKGQGQSPAPRGKCFVFAPLFKGRKQGRLSLPPWASSSADISSDGRSHTARSFAAPLRRFRQTTSPSGKASESIRWCSRWCPAPRNDTDARRTHPSPCFATGTRETQTPCRCRASAPSTPPAAAG